jgi:hypothetical protein
MDMLLVDPCDKVGIMAGAVWMSISALGRRMLLVSSGSKGVTGVGWILGDTIEKEAAEVAG